MERTRAGKGSSLARLPGKMSSPAADSYMCPRQSNAHAKKRDGEPTWPRLSPRCFHKHAPALHPPYLSRHLPMRCTVSSRSGTHTLHTSASQHGLSEFFFCDEIPQCSTIVSKNSKLVQTSKHTLHASGENGGISVRSTTELAKGRIIERRNSNRYHERTTRKAEISRRYIYVIVVDTT